MKRRRKARRKRRRKAVAAVPWRVARGSWSHEDRVRSSPSKTAFGVSTEGSQRCKRSILQCVLGARNRDPIAAGDGGKADREAVSQE